MSQLFMPCASLPRQHIHPHVVTFLWLCRVLLSEGFLSSVPSTQIFLGPNVLLITCLVKQVPAGCPAT